MLNRENKPTPKPLISKGAPVEVRDGNLSPSSVKNGVHILTNISALLEVSSVGNGAVSVHQSKDHPLFALCGLSRQNTGVIDKKK
eukprot:5623257-Amphidinium_carterae.1